MMKHISLILLLVLGLASPVWSITKITDVTFDTDFTDTESGLSGDQSKRVSGATQITGGVMSTVRGNRTQLVTHSVDLTNAAWAVTDVTKDTATTCTFDAQNGHISDTIATSDNCYYFLSFKARRITGNTDIDVYFNDSATGNSVEITHATVYYWDGSAWQSDTSGGLTASLLRYYVLVLGKAGGGNVNFGLQDTNAAGHGQVEFTEIQVEKLEGPSALPGVELVTDGGFANVTTGAEALDDPTLENAAEWDDTDGNVTQNAGAGTVTWDGLGAGDFFTTDGAGQFTVGDRYKIVVVIDSMSAGALEVTEGSYAFQGTNTNWTSAGTKTIYLTCNNDLDFGLSGDATCDAVVSNISTKKLTLDDWTEGDYWGSLGSAEKAYCSGGQGGSVTISQNASLIAGQAYYTTFTIFNYVNGDVVIYVGSGGVGTFRGANGTYNEVVICSGGTMKVYVFANATFEGEIGDVSIKEITFPGPLEPGTYTATAGATATIPAEARFEDSRLLVEGEGTNYVGYSEDSTKLTANRVTIIGSQTDLAGGTDAWKLVEDDTGANTHYGYLPTGHVIDAGIADDTVINVSVRIKKGGSSSRDWIRLDIKDRGGTARGSSFDLANGVVGTAAGGATRKIESLGNGYYKCSISHSIGNGANDNHIYMWICEADNDITFDGDSTTYADGFIVHGIQLEDTAFSTSYIPTTGGYPVTRTTEAGSSADNGVKWTMGAAVMNALAEGTIAGTLIFDWTPEYDHDEDSGNYSIISCQDNYQSLVYVAGASALSTYDGTTVASVNLNWVAGTTYTIGLRWSDADNVLQIGVRQAEGSWSWGASQALDATGFTIGADDELKLGYSCEFPFYIDNLTFWDDAFELAKTTIAGAGSTLTYTLIDATGGGYFDGLIITGANNIVENCTIYAPYGVALNADEDCTVTNCILEGYDKDVDVANTKTVTTKNNCLSNHANKTDNIGDGTFDDANSVYAQDPLFWNLTGRDFRLTAASPCRDTGFDTGADTDLNGVVTPRYGIHDIGAYEYFKSPFGRKVIFLYDEED